jgi:hypothetical protein
MSPVVDGDLEPVSCAKIEVVKRKTRIKVRVAKQHFIELSKG